METRAELSNQYIILVDFWLLQVCQSLTMLVNFACSDVRRRIITEQVVDDLKCCSVSKVIARNVGVSFYLFEGDG